MPRNQPALIQAASPYPVTTVKYHKRLQAAGSIHIVEKSRGLHPFNPPLLKGFQVWMPEHSTIQKRRFQIPLWI
jgi:hypothetical protein